MNEFIKPPPGFAIISRFNHPSAEDRSTVIGSSLYFLSPGQGIIFYGESYGTTIALHYNQKDMLDALGQFPESQFQLNAQLDIHGRLHLLYGPNSVTSGMHASAPQVLSVMRYFHESTTFLGVWGITEKAAMEKLQNLLQKPTNSQ